MWNISEGGWHSAFSTPENWTRWEMGPRTKELFPFESVDDEYWYNFQSQYWWIFWVITASYWIATYALQRVMRDREPLALDGFMVTYNSAVALFSIFALWRVSTSFFPVLFSGPDGFYKTVCVRFPITEKEVFWLIVCGWSKVIHFMDTIFSVLRKRPIQFMQIYHHSVVVLVPQHVLPYGEPILIWWGTINLLQHSITYPYHCLKAMKVKVPRIAATAIVVVEVLQMLTGLGTGVYSLYVLRNGGHCVRHPKSISIMYFVYATMTVLALQMAYEHFIKKQTVIPTNTQGKVKSS